MSKLKAHPYADLFPMMTAAELESLAADVAEHGLRQPVVRYQGAVLDGRNRLLACEKAGAEPTFVDHEGDDASALALVISLNVQRRDLNAAQRAIVAARAADAPRGRPSKNGTEGTVFSVERAAKTFKVGIRQVKEAKALLAEAPDLAAQVEGCSLSLDNAYGQLQDRRKQQEQKRKDSERVAEYKDAISSGETTLEKALQEIMERERQERERVTQTAQARQLWLGKLAELIGWVETSVATRDDEHLAWYTEPGAPGTDTALTPDHIDSAVRALERVRFITFGRTQDHVTTGSAKARTRAP